jgi:hypothetical protein
MKWVVRRGDAAVGNGKMHTSLSMEPVPSSATTRPAFPVVAFMMRVVACQVWQKGGRGELSSCLRPGSKF